MRTTLTGERLHGAPPLAEELSAHGRNTAPTNPEPRPSNLRGTFMIRLIRFATGFLISFGLLAWAITRADLAKVRDIFAAADGMLILVALGILLTSHVLHSYRWIALISALGGSVRFSRLLAVHFLGLLYNSLLPAQLGIDTARIQFGGMLAGSRSRMLVLAMADRLIGAVSLALVAGVASLVLGTHDSRLWPLAAAPVIVLGGATLLVLAPRMLPAATERWLHALGGRSRFGPWLLSLVSTAGRLANQPRLLTSVAVTACIQLAITSMALGILSDLARAPRADRPGGPGVPTDRAGHADRPDLDQRHRVRKAMFCATTIPLGLDQSSGPGAIVRLVRPRALGRGSGHPRMASARFPSLLDRSPSGTVAHSTGGRVLLHGRGR